MKIRGTILSFGAKGFGFAVCDSTTTVFTNRTVFIHIKQVRDGRFLHEGDRISFDVVPSAKHPGKLDAVDVEFLEPAHNSEVRQ